MLTWKNPIGPLFPRLFARPTWVALSLLPGLFLPLMGCGSASHPAHAPSQLKSSKTSQPIEVLFLLSSASEQQLQNGSTRPTGTFLGEFYEPYRDVTSAGHRATIVTPQGRPPAFDPEGMKDKYWDEHELQAEALRFASRAFREPSSPPVLSLDEALAQVEEYDALVIPGGQGVMVDVVPDPKAAELVLTLSKKEKPIGLICHAPALLVHLPLTNPLSGRHVTAVSPFEEFFIETFVMKGKAQNRKIGRQLRQRGYRYHSALPKANHATRDRNLVTSQNPFSGSSFSEQFQAALDEYLESKARPGATQKLARRAP